MAEQTLLDERLLSSTAFVRDFEVLLNLSADALLAISKSDDGQDGFIGHGHSRNLNARFNIPIDKAARVLRIVEHLYNRVSALDLDVTAAVDQISSIASELEAPIKLDDQKRDALKAVLSFNRAYELPMATAKALDNVPHYGGVAGEWSVKPIRIRDGEIVKVPVVTVSVYWHDSTANHKQAFFYMSDADWDEFVSKVEAIKDNRKDIEDLLQ